MGGFILIRSYHPLDILSIPSSLDLYCSVLHPKIEVHTEVARKMLKNEITMQQHVTQTGNAAGLVLALIEGNAELLSRCLEDVIAEPIRSQLIPGFSAIKSAAINEGCPRMQHLRLRTFPICSLSKPLTCRNDRNSYGKRLPKWGHGLRPVHLKNKLRRAKDTLMMTFYSTNNRGLKVSLKEAVLSGLAPDGGLYMPESITPLSSDFFRKIHSMSFQEIAFTVGKHLLQGAIPEEDLKHIIEESLSFDAPIVKITDSIYSLELFHGPTLSFKDFGARFLARLTAYLIQGQSRDLNILVATSGDTGSAVGYGFFNVPGIKVYILYPKGLVTPIQEKQLTTIGSNVTAVEVDGLFDDCQAMVKRAFNDNELCQRINLTSANSINIGRPHPTVFLLLLRLRTT
jgi:hypothetical protein